VNSISANLNIMIKASEKASKVLIRDFGELEKLQASRNGSNDFVKNSKLKVEKIIIEELIKARPNYSILNNNLRKINKKNLDSMWILNPIGGLKNFSHGIPHFALSIAVQSNNEIVSGLVFDPIKNELFYAEKNNGAFLNNQRIRVSKKNKVEECLFATNQQLAKKVNIDFRKSGSAILDLAYIASGRYDGFFQKNLKLCDVAAGIILISEAGGMINEVDLDQQNNIQIIASSSDIYQKLINDIVSYD
jgi:myo-inositol-1(or 4)-monophosphatase